MQYVSIPKYDLQVTVEVIKYVVGLNYDSGQKVYFESTY